MAYFLLRGVIEGNTEKGPSEAFVLLPLARHKTRAVYGFHVLRADCGWLALETDGVYRFWKTEDCEDQHAWTFEQVAALLTDRPALRAFLEKERSEWDTPARPESDGVLSMRGMSTGGEPFNPFDDDQFEALVKSLAPGCLPPTVNNGLGFSPITDREVNLAVAAAPEIVVPD